MFVRIICRYARGEDTFDTVRTPAELTSTFRANGLKVTPQRQLLFRLLHDNTDHPTADGLFATASQLMPGISLRTVYQTLNDLAAMGELHVLQLSGGPTRFDPNLADHHHAKCDACGDLRDVYVPHVDSLHVSGFAGFVPQRASIMFRGLCAACQATPSSPLSSPSQQGDNP